MVLNIKKYIRLRTIEYAVLGLKVVCVLLTCLGVVYLFGGVLYRELSESIADLNELKVFRASLDELPPLAEPSRQQNNRSLDIINKRELFGELSPIADQSSKPVEKKVSKVTKVPLTLIGTFITENEPSYAIVENKNGRVQDVFLVGDSVFDTATLHSIESEKVIIDRDGSLEELVLKEGSLGGSSSSPGEDSEVMTVPLSDVEEALNNLPLLLTQARTVPYFSNGKRDGLRLFAIRQGSFFQKIGLKNGDILKKINGNELNDPSKALALFEKLKTERSLTVKLVRNRKDKLIEYEIQ